MPFSVKTKVQLLEIVKQKNFNNKGFAVNKLANQTHKSCSNCRYIFVFII